MDNLSASQLSMIKACLATAKEIREEAVRCWEEEVVMNDLDFSSSRLIPYFFYRNQQDGIITKHDKRIKVIYKHWWLRTQHISHQLKEVHAALSREGVKVVVIKGASIKMHYERAELRPMADFDLLVALDDLPKARQIINDMGYLNEIPDTFWKTDRKIFFDFNHAISYTHQDNCTQIDLHWKVGSRCSAQFTDGLWLHLDNYEVIPKGKKPQLAYEVFMLIIHAVDSGNKDNLNWIIDIAVINSQNDLSFWEEARELAVAEKKADIFDYGCVELLKLGVYALKPSQGVKKHRTTINTDYKSRKQMNIIKLQYVRVQNTILKVNRFFPYANTFAKLYYITGIAKRFFISSIKTKKS